MVQVFTFTAGSNVKQLACREVQQMDTDMTEGLLTLTELTPSLLQRRLSSSR